MDLIISLMEYAQSRYSLVLLMVFLLTFTKSCAVISLLIPGTSGLLLFGTLASASVGHFLLMWMSASLGAIGGFWLSWLTGYRYRHHLHRIRWLNAERLARGQLFLRRHGQDKGWHRGQQSQAQHACTGGSGEQGGTCHHLRLFLSDLATL